MSCAGDLLEGRYELEAQLGAGGTARVFRARDLVTKAVVAIKLMEPGREQDPEAVAYFSQEGRLAARIRDPHLVPALHFGVDEGRHFIVYDYLPGSAPLSVLAGVRLGPLAFLGGDGRPDHGPRMSRHRLLHRAGDHERGGRR